jgi:hypothetical protein
MKETILNFDNFELPLLLDVNAKDTNIAEYEYDNVLVKEHMESRIPKSAIFLGEVHEETDHMTSTWQTNDAYYISPLQGDEYNWAVFRISWDDNFGSWIWCPDGRLKGAVTDYKEAARIILTELWEQWQIDKNDSENEAYLHFFEQL